VSAAPLSTVWWQCTRKRRYWTEAEAKTAQRQVEHATRRKYRRYICPHCGHYHLAKRPSR